jgi:hypothetical protein
MALGRTADAQVSVDCNSNPSALQSAVASNTPGTSFAITGLCQGTVSVGTSLALLNHLGSDTLQTSDGIQGELVITGSALVLIDGITLEGTASDTGLPDILEVLGTPTVGIENSRIINGQRMGLNINGGATVVIANTTISGNGIAHVAGQSDGISAVSAAILLGGTNSDGSVDPTQAVTIANNFGNGIGLFGHGHLAMAGGIIQNNGGNQAFLAGASDLEFVGTQVFQNQTPSMPGAFAIQALGGSTVGLFSGSVVSGGGVAGAVLVASAGSLFMNGALLANTSLSVPTIQISGSSNGVLGGGNTIQNTQSGGTVLQIDHASSFQQVGLAGYMPELLAGIHIAPAPDSLSGSAFVQEQSQFDIGMGTISGNPSLTWSVPAGNCILVQQNSSLRLSGGVTISGAAPSACALNGNAVSSTITIQQESNGFFNLSQGGLDEIDGGGNVACAFAGMPNAHVTGKANISPAAAQPVVIGSLAAALNATSPGCLGP